jgi:hypothetical protein
MSKKKLFEYAVLFHEKDEKGKVTNTKIIIEPKTELAEKESDLVFKITREIPENYASTPDNIEIFVKPF